MTRISAWICHIRTGGPKIIAVVFYLAGHSLSAAGEAQKHRSEPPPGDRAAIRFAQNPSTADAGACTQDFPAPPVQEDKESVQALLKDIPVTTKWADVPAGTQAKLQKHADNRLAAFRARWAADALAKKQRILLECPTPAMTSAIDDYYRKAYTVVPDTFSLKDVKNAALARALTRNYLGTLAALRAGLSYPDGNFPNRDWDGKSTFDSVRLPDKQTNEDIQKFSATIVQELKAIDDASLNGLEQALKQRALFDSRAFATGAFSRDSYGGADMQSVCEIVTINYDILGGYELDNGRPAIFASDADVLREANALYLRGTPLKWVDVGTVRSALEYCDFTGPDLVKNDVGDPATNDVAKGMILLKNWWIERLSASKDAQNACSVYSAANRTQIWEAFSADQQFNNDGTSSMETYMSFVGAYRNDKAAQYRRAVRLALDQVFPDDAILTQSQRQQVIAAIDADPAFGLYPGKIAAALDIAQGGTDGAAATKWKDAVVADVALVGGNYGTGDPVRPDDEALIRSMFEEVKVWVASRYQGYPIDIASLYPKIEFVVGTKNNATTAPPGRITFGVGTARSKMEYYSLLIHELRHAVHFAWKANAPDKSKVMSDEGPALEGSGVAVEALLLEPFLRQTLQNDRAYALYALDYGIRDARFAGTTDATLQKYFRPGCSNTGDEDTLEFTKRIAESYGLTGKLADNLALRAHAGTQYFQYIWGGLWMLQEIAFLQNQLDPSGKRQIDPFVLFSCGLNTPNRGANYAALLKACMKL